MAITKLGHLKESKQGDKASHLRRLLNYIYNPKKTDDCRLCFSDCGETASQIFQQMIETKEEFDKTSGRQGYHYVISLMPGEGTPELLFNLTREFCNELLHGEFEYAYAVHVDQPHLHAHIAFNSVNRYDGSKYRYANGDWKKYIQPITDRLCQKYGLTTLSYDENETKRVPDAFRHAEKENRFTWKNIIRSDIDYAISQSETLEDYFRQMEKLGYEITRTGHSKKHGAYLAYKPPLPPDSDSEKKQRAHRDYNLGAGYTFADVKRRIVDRTAEKTFSAPEPAIGKTMYVNLSSGKNRFIVVAAKRMRVAYEYRFIELKLRDQARARQDLLKIQKIEEELAVIYSLNIHSWEDAQDKLKDLKKSIYEIRNANEASEQFLSQFTSEELADRKLYMSLSQELQDQEDTMSDERFEEITDQLSALEEKYTGNFDVFRAQPQVNQYELQRLEYQKAALSRFIRSRQDYFESEKILLASINSEADLPRGLFREEKSNEPMPATTSSNKNEAEEHPLLPDPSQKTETAEPSTVILENVSESDTEKRSPDPEYITGKETPAKQVQVESQKKTISAGTDTADEPPRM